MALAVDCAGPCSEINPKADSHTAYFTLEMTFNGMSPPAVDVGLLCGWRGRTHANYSRLIRTEPSEFVAAVQAHLNRPK